MRVRFALFMSCTKRIVKDWGIALTILLAFSSMADASGERMRLVMHTGERLEGRVYDLRNQYLEIQRSLGSKQFPKSEVDSWVLIPDEDAASTRGRLIIVLNGGHEIGGNVSFVPETLEWVVELAAGEARYPEKEVQRTIPPSGITSDGRFTPRLGFQQVIEKAIAEVRSGEKLEVASGSQTLRDAGFFALSAMEKSIEAEGPNETLKSLILEERFRVVVPVGIEEKLPNLLSDLMQAHPTTRVEVLREALVETGSDLYPLLGLLLLDPNQPKEVRSFSIDVLGRMHRVQELITAYSVAEGRAQFAVAVALGDNGIYLGIPTLIETLEIEARGEGLHGEVSAAAFALQRLREYSGENFGYDPNGTPESRAEAVQQWRNWWDQNRGVIEDSVRESLVEGEESPRRRRAADLWRQGMLARARGQQESASGFFERAHQEDPTAAAPLISLGIIAYTYRKDPQAGIDYFRQALGREEATGEESLRRLCYFHLGRIYQLGRDYDMARRSLLKAVETDPTFSGAWYELGMVRYQQGLLISGEDAAQRREALSEARDSFGEGIEALERYRDAQTLLDLTSLPYDAELPFSTRDHNRSLRDIRNRLDVEIGRFHYQMAVISVALGEATVALQHLRQAKLSTEVPDGTDTLERVIERLLESQDN